MYVVAFFSGIYNTWKYSPSLESAGCFAYKTQALGRFFSPRVLDILIYECTHACVPSRDGEASAYMAHNAQYRADVRGDSSDCSADYD